ncbi:hypothetical protein TNCV_1609121 [Trichonephila clavipes]|nr:hypothetical protein TNCV_1609121 [Trichonephila clavipes]
MPRSFTVYASGSRFMSRPMRSHRCSMIFRSGEFAGQRRMSNPARLLTVYRVTCCLALSSWNTVLGAFYNKDRTTDFTTCVT